MVEIDPQKVVNPRELIVAVLPSGIGKPNRLFIYTGIIGDLEHKGLYSMGGNMTRETVMLNLSKLHNRNFDGHPFSLIVTNGQLLAAPVASLASVAINEGDFVVAVDKADADEDNQQLRLLIDLAIQGDPGTLHRVSYQVNVPVRSQ